MQLNNPDLPLSRQQGVSVMVEFAAAPDPASLTASVLSGEAIPAAAPT